MDEDEYVDTSDPEERAELLEFFPTRIATSSPGLRKETPRKRRKIEHLDGSDSPHTPSRTNASSKLIGSPLGSLIRRGTENISSTPQLVSIASSPTAATVELPFGSPLTQKASGFYVDDILVEDDYVAFSQDYRQVEPNEKVRLDDILSGMEVSDDELDVMSQATRTSQKGNGVTSGGTTAPSPSPYKTPLGTISMLQTSSRAIARNDSDKTMKDGDLPVLSLFTQHPEDLPGVGHKNERAPSPMSPLSSDEGDPGPLRPLRFTSLPPSSPIRASAPASSPQRARSHSPEISQRQSRAHSSVDGDGDNTQHVPEEDNAPRRYSLRDRQPRQLNPYEYDKRMYKMQLRRIPEAIVRVVSPPKRPGEHGQRHKSHETGEDEFIAPEETEESQEQWVAKKHHRRLADNNHEVNALKPDLLKRFELSDDDLSPLPSLPSREPAAPREHGENTIRKRRKKPFPLAPKVNQIRPVSDEERPANETYIAIGYGRRKKRNRPAGPPPHQSQSAGKHSGPSQSPHSIDIAHDDDRRKLLESGDNVSRTEDNIYDDVDSVFFNRDGHFDLGHWQNSPGICNQKASSPIVASDSNGTRASNRHRLGAPDDEEETPQENQKESSKDEDNEDDSDEEETQEEMDRKRLKVLRRMMPAFMINKMLGPQAHPQARPNTQRRSLSVPSSEQSSEDEGPLVPGKSKIRRRPGVGQTVLQIKGDSESSETEQMEVEKECTPISIMSSDSEAFGVESERSDEDQGEILDGIARTEDFEDDISKHYRSSRKREDLIDRMLSRTRAEGFRKASRTTRRRVGHGRSGSGPTSLRKTGLDVHISASRSHTGGRQTRLPFAPVHSDNHSDTPEDYIDLAGVPDEINLDEYGVEQPRKLTKKQRREAALQKQLFTVNTGHKQVGNGRKKGFIQIDIKDDAFHAALAPVRSDVSEKPRRIFKKSISEARTVAIPMKPAFLKQSSLHDFPHHDDGVLVDIGRMEYQENSAVHIDDTAWKDNSDMQSLTRLTVDFEISPVPSGVRFGSSTYLGKHMLHDLIAFINGGYEKRMPLSYNDFEGITLSQDMSTTQLSEALEIANNVLRDWISSSNSKDDNDDVRVENHSRYDALMSSLTHTCIWLFDKEDEERKRQMLVMISDFLRRLRGTVRDRLTTYHGSTQQSNDRMLSVLWFNVAFSVRWSVLRQRSGVDGFDEWSDAVTTLMGHLLGFNLQKVLSSIQLAGNSINEETVLVHVAELWICLIHLLPSLSSHSSSIPSPDHAFWFHVQQALKVFDTNGRPDLENSEFQWRLLFGLNALGHFTAHGIATTNNYLAASWETVVATLDSIKLIHSPTDDKLPFAALRKRDHYVRMVVARCYLLGTRWQWPMRDAYVMFNKLVEIFKSRKFGNLLGEESDFPAFLRYSNLHMLKELRKSDSAFGLFLKLVVLAGQCKSNDIEPAQRVNARLRKLLSLTVPLSGVPFSKANPPLGQELSMLYNRFSSIVVAIYLEPTAANLRNRFAQARRYVAFSQADWKSRQACIRALMYASILVQHLDLPLDEPSSWLEEMVENLMHDYDDAEGALKARGNKQASSSVLESRNKAILTIQLLLGCVRKIMETHTMQPDGPVTLRYPPLILIDAPWIKRIFAKKDLTASITTRMEILKLLLSFLDARDKVIPTPLRPTLTSLTEVETQESQDEYGPFDIDFNDPELIAALDNGGEKKQMVDENKNSDMKAAEIMDTCILPLVLRLMMQQVHDSSALTETRLEEYWLDVDKWVSCWVRCAAIVVANEKRNWSHYLNLGSQSWKIIGDSTLRRRVGLRFMLGLLLSDPSSYKDQQESYHEVLLESMVTHKVTVEHEFVSLLFSIDGLRHTMFRGINIPREDEHADFKLTRTAFLELRLSLINCILTNIELCLTKFSRGEHQLQYLCNRWVDYLLTMLSTMKDILQNLQSDIERANYRNFCSKVLNTVKSHPLLQSHSRLSGIIAWSAIVGVSA